MEKGAKSVRAVLTHPVLSGQSMETISKSPLSELIVSDTIVSVYDKVNYYNTEICSKIECPKISIISCSNLLTNSIARLIKHESINELNS